MRRVITAFSATACLLLASAEAAGATYQVSPSGPYTSIQDVVANETLAPGDVVEVEGGHTYPGDLWLKSAVSGADGNPIIFRGVEVNGQRPVLQGVGTEAWHDMVIYLYADHVTFEGFEIIGDSQPEHTCIIARGTDITFRDMFIHDCAGHGILGTDDGSGNMVIEYSEFARNGTNPFKHSIYVTTDQGTFPKANVRIQYNYIHDTTGGLGIKSRAERTEIYYNWIEGAALNTLDLVGPESNFDFAVEEADVVGNVLVHSSIYSVARMGDDGTAGTDGVYRFSNNTVVVDNPTATVFRPQVNIESLELFNNVFCARSGTPRFYKLTEYTGSLPLLSGSNNFIDDAFTDVPVGFTNTITGDPGFTDEDLLDLRPTADSPLVDAGTEVPEIPGAVEDEDDPAQVPDPLVDLGHVPPARDDADPEERLPRDDDGMPDLGAFPYGDGKAPGPGSDKPSPDQTAITNDGVNTGATGCAIRAGHESDASPWWLYTGLIGAMIWRRRQSHRNRS